MKAELSQYSNGNSVRLIPENDSEQLELAKFIITLEEAKNLDIYCDRLMVFPKKYTRQEKRERP